MRLVTTDAIVLRTYNLAEADRIVLCLTRSAGLVRAVAKGARRMKSRFGAALEPFTLIRLAFHEKENRELVTLSSAEILKSYFDLSARVEAVEVLAYMGELVNEFAPPHAADEKLFRMLAACVDALATRAGHEHLIMRYFEVWLLRLGGLFPDLNSCADCGAALSNFDNVRVDNELTTRCGDCGGDGVSVFSPEVLRTVRASQRLSPAKFTDSQKLSAREDAELSELTHRLIARAIDRRPRTLVAGNR